MLRQVLTIPDPMCSAQQFARYNHLDIPDMADEELETELWALRSLLFWLPPQHWIRDRVQELGKEYGRRHYTQRPQIPKRSEDFY